MSLQNFIEILIHRYDLPFFIPIVSFIYINRILRIPNASVVLSEFTPNRLTAVAIIVASKYYLEDTVYIKNSKWISKVCMGLFKTGELNSLECLFLRSLDYHINVSYLEWKEYLEQIDKSLHELKLKYNNELNNKNNTTLNTNNIHINHINSSSSIQPFTKKENTINNVNQLFALLDNHILDDNQLISYDPSLEPNFSVIYNLLETPSNSTSSSPQPNYIHNSEIQKIKKDLDANNHSIQNDHSTSTSTSCNDKVMDEDKPISGNNRKTGTHMESENQNYHFTGILTPPSSSSSSSSQSINSNNPRLHHTSKINGSNDDIDIIVDDCKEEEEEEEERTSNPSTNQLLNSTSISSQHHSKINSISNSNFNSNNLKNQNMVYTPNSQLKTNTLSSLYQHNPDLKNTLENHSITGRLTAGHSNHYGSRYHPFSRSGKSTTPETKRNGLPLFSPIKTSDKPITAVSPYVYSLLNKHSMSKSNKIGDPSESSEAQSEMFVSPIPNSFNENRCSNAIRSFRIIDSDDDRMKNNQNQMSVEDIASKYSITKSKNTREYVNKDRHHKSSIRSSISYSSRNRKHRYSISSHKDSNTTTSSPNSSFTSTSPNTSITHTSDTNIINLGLGISKKSKLITKASKVNIPKAKNQKLITSYLTTMMESQQNNQSNTTSTPNSLKAMTNSTSTTFLRHFPSITKLLNRFNVRKEKKTVS